MAEQVDWGKVRELLDRASRAPEWPEHYEIARAFLTLDALVGEMAEEMSTELGFMDSMWDGARIKRWEILITRAKETCGE